MLSYIDTIFATLKQYDLLLALLFILIYWVLKHSTEKAIQALAETKTVNATRTAFINRCFNIIYFGFLFATYLIVSGIGYGNFSIFISSVFTVIGVGFIAQWSILSNITASFLIFFVFPYRIGDSIIVADGDGIEGKILDIKMFHTLIRHPEGNVITYPNSLLLQKSVTKVSPKNSKYKVSVPRKSNKDAGAGVETVLEGQA
ncbi:Mechanosensitive ion channel family protein [Vibrio chagasii]|jgi:small-conductance mechanosensitive channel|uniref:Small-conductance mechanosensitive channel n=1 Tax=Vibrio chagasii TaxID=170679 RepID=A0A7Y4DTR6_9VIBR|nr:MULTISPECIES: mechanosensitive ion channel family protein [Vibrio]MCG9694039.1 mechanosensitive ion channel family protein [Vibrio sp. Isolate22]MDA0155651.1 mechanosensitive ion channel family protein [Vibrio sp. Makdt]NOH36040.1 mechanosensitive ion channel family protein [Vibrio chagasii]CAH6851773.1 Mechanosensitive ion channel family protein [Vibrio chagasii]CAH6869860.1 Mechanosensitive ion channel family protein [Vibrio chagasii]